MNQTEGKRMIAEIIRELSREGRIRKSRSFIQHGNTSVYEHSVRVAYYSLKAAEFLHLNGHRKELVRGALLHDYFLYDWHIPDKENPHRLHGFYHPGVALRNASKEYELTEREKNIIRRHMWPLTVVPPRCREAWIVTTADKWCSFMETLHMLRGHGIVLQRHDDEEYIGDGRNWSTYSNS